MAQLAEATRCAGKASSSSWKKAAYQSELLGKRVSLLAARVRLVRARPGAFSRAAAGQGRSTRSRVAVWNATRCTMTRQRRRAALWARGEKGHGVVF